jgi:predicted nucleic acid-binding protein
VITAIDSSVILAIFKREATAEPWLQCLTKAAGSGPLVICEVVFAELAAYFLRASDLRQQLDNLAINLLPSNEDSLFEAGRIFSTYRRSGGARTNMVPDFLIGAHARVQADQLASADRGYLRQYFGDLNVLDLRKS